MWPLSVAAATDPTAAIHFLLTWGYENEALGIGGH